MEQLSLFPPLICDYVLSPEHKDQHQTVSGVLSSVDRPGGAGWRENGEGGGVHQDYAGAHR